MNIDEAKKLKEQAEDSINKILLEFYYQTELSLRGVDVTINRHETLAGKVSQTIDVKINVCL